MTSVAAAAQSIETFSRAISEKRLVWGSTAKGLIFPRYGMRVNAGRRLTPRSAGRRKAGESASSNRNVMTKGRPVRPALDPATAPTR